MHVEAAKNKGQFLIQYAKDILMPLCSYFLYLSYYFTLDMGALPMPVYEKMQRISEGYLRHLGIDLNEKDEKVRLFENEHLLTFFKSFPLNQGNTLLHNLVYIKPGQRVKTSPIDCLVSAGADLSSQDSAGRTPLMTAIINMAPKANIRKLIHLCEGTLAHRPVDNKNNNVLHL